MLLSSLQKGLVGSWNLDEASLKSSVILGDKTPYNNDGVSANAPVFVADRFGNTRAIRLDGTDDCVRIPDSESLSPINAMTAMVWVKGAAQIDKGVLTNYDIGINQRAYRITAFSSAPNNKIGVIISSDGTYGIGQIKNYQSSITAFDNNWHLIGFSFDAGTLKLFVDGVEDPNPTKTTDDAITTIHNSTADVMLGCYLNSDTPSGFFNGDLARPKMWNRALTDAEWLTAYESYSSKIVI